MRVLALPGHERRARKLLTVAERAAAELEIALAPIAWPVVAGTGGARKARAARGAKGKRGGARDVYAKGDKEDLTDADKKAIRRLTAGLETAP
jgi:hypothetical protein